MRLSLNKMICDFIPLLLRDKSNFCCDKRSSKIYWKNHFLAISQTEMTKEKVILKN